MVTRTTAPTWKSANSAGRIAFCATVSTTMPSAAPECCPPNPSRRSPARTCSPSWSDEAWPSRAPSPDGDVEAEHRTLADVGPRADRHPAGPDPPCLGVVAVEEHVPADDRSGSDGEQVGDERHPPGDDQRAPADVGAERAEEQVVDRRAGREGDGTDPQERLDRPQPEVGSAPDPDLGLPPASDQDPLDQDRDGAGEPERQPSREHTAPVGRDRALGPQGPRTHPEGELHDHPRVGDGRR